jgi:hypothetical protein
VSLEFEITHPGILKGTGLPSVESEVIKLLKLVNVNAVEVGSNGQIFPMEESDTWQVCHKYQQDSHPLVGKYIICVRTSALLMEPKSFHIVRRVCVLLKDKYTIDFPLNDCCLCVLVSKPGGEFGDRLLKYISAFIWAMQYPLDKLHPLKLTITESDN